MKFRLHFSLYALSIFLSWGCGNSSHSFVAASLEEALAELDPEGEATLVDEDADGVADAIDTDGDGEGDIPFEGGDDTDGGSDADDPEYPLRDQSGGSCNDEFVNATVLTGPSGENTLVRTLNGSHKVILVSQSSSGNTFTINLDNVTNLQRVIVKVSGNTNAIHINGAEMSVGFCNDMSGGNNELTIDVASSAPTVDLESGTGNNNGLDALFVPTEALLVSLAGNDNCISAPPGTEIDIQQNSGSDSEVLDTGETCN